MKNKEKYVKEIMEIACNGSRIAVMKGSGRIVPCDSIICNVCLFSDDCRKNIKEWAESDIDKPVISKKDRAFLEYIDTRISYITRDMDGSLFIYISKPHKKLIDCWKRDWCKSLNFFKLDFPMVKWEDDKPWRIEDLKKLEVVEEYEK